MSSRVSNLQCCNCNIISLILGRVKLSEVDLWFNNLRSTTKRTLPSDFGKKLVGKPQLLLPREMTPASNNLLISSLAFSKRCGAMVLLLNCIGDPSTFTWYCLLYTSDA